MLTAHTLLCYSLASDPTYIFEGRWRASQVPSVDNMPVSLHGYSSWTFPPLVSPLSIACVCSKMKEISGHQWPRSSSRKERESMWAARGMRQSGPGCVKRFKALYNLTCLCPQRGLQTPFPSQILSCKVPSKEQTSTCCICFNSLEESK